MRWTRKIVIVGLAAFGVQRLIQLARPRVEHARDRVTPHLHDAADRARGAADDVASDVNDARQVLKDATQDVSADLADAAHEAKAEADHVVHDIKSFAEHQGSSFGDAQAEQVEPHIRIHKPPHGVGALSIRPTRAGSVYRRR